MRETNKYHFSSKENIQKYFYNWSVLVKNQIFGNINLEITWPLHYLQIFGDYKGIWICRCYWPLFQFALFYFIFLCYITLHWPLNIGRSFYPSIIFFIKLTYSFHSTFTIKQAYKTRGKILRYEMGNWKTLFLRTKETWHDKKKERQREKRICGFVTLVDILSALRRWTKFLKKIDIYIQPGSYFFYLFIPNNASPH